MGRGDFSKCQQMCDIVIYLRVDRRCEILNMWSGDLFWLKSARDHNLS